MRHRSSLFALAVVVVLGAAAGTDGTRMTHALVTDSEAVASTLSSAAVFDTVAPTISDSVVSKSVPYVPGFIRQGGTYHIYANVTDGGTPPSGVASVTADVSAITTGQTSVPLVAASFSIGGVAYAYRSAALTANASLSAGPKPYGIAAVDGSGNAATRTDLSVIVDNTRPAGTDVQTANSSGGTAGRPELGDTITFTFSEPIDPHSVLAGWTGTATSVVVRISNGGLANDSLTVRDAANSTQLPFGSVNLGGISYVSTLRDFGASGTPSSMVLSGNAITITLGTASGGVGTELIGAHMAWTPTTTMSDRAGNACQTTSVTESGALVEDVEF